MPRVAVALSCTLEVKSELERLARSRSGQVRMCQAIYVFTAAYNENAVPFISA